MKATIQQRADRRSGDDCYFVLRDFVSWFDDPHLFIYESADLDSAESTRRAGAVAKRTITETSARSYFHRKGADSTPSRASGTIGGSASRSCRIPRKARGDSWRCSSPATRVAGSPGACARTSRSGADGSYDVDLAGRNYSVAHLRGEIFRHVLLRLSPGIWGKAFPVSAADTNTLDPVDPHRPVLYKRNGTLVFAIPSHNGFKAVIDSMVEAHRTELASADRLIIDLRGNEGGSSSMTDALGPYVSLKTDLPNPFPLDKSMILSSPSQISYARRGFGSDTSAFVRSLVRRMESHPGELVPLDDPATPPAPTDPRDWVIASGPRAVGVITDRGTVSASEVVVVYALQSARATVFGEPTAGALDYESVSIISISPREPRWALGYGTITRAGDLPRGGMRGKGIPPQVPLDLARIADPVAYVNTALAKRK